jgi:predicted transposase YbfD/YdcC
LPNGIPSRDCIRRLLVVLKPEAFQRCFQARIADAIPIDADASGRLVAIDGKSCRGSHDGAKGLGALHIVSAWASEQGIALGQVATDAKSNEITAIPQLLGQIDLAGTLITIDAMGCQKEIVEQVVAGGGDCVIAVKDNQPKLLAAIRTHFLDHLENDLKELQYRSHETLEDGHGRIDERSYYLTEVPRGFAPAKDWPWVKAIGLSVRITRQADGTESDEVRYYLSSRYLSGQRFGEAVRGHWGIESMHWVLDVNFGEDDSRTRERTLGNNLSWLRRFAVTLLKRHPDKDSLRGKMMSCMLNTDYLTQVLSLQHV